MKKMTDTELIQNTVEYYAEDWDRRSLADGICMYRGRGGKKCAIGRLIPDEMYDPIMEGESIEGKHVLLVLEDLGYNNFEVLLSLQKWHDKYCFFLDTSIELILDACEAARTGPSVSIFAGTYD